MTTVTLGESHMKKIMSIVSLVVATHSFAAVDCKPFNEDVKIAQSVVDNFQFEVQKLHDKLYNIEGHITDKMRLLDPITSDISMTHSMLDSLKGQKQDLRQSLNSLQAQLDQDLQEEMSLTAQISNLEVQINNMSSRDPSRRNLMREKNRMKKVLEMVQSSIAQKSSAINPMRANLNQIKNHISQKESKLIQLEQDKVIIENQKPKLSALMNSKQNLIQDIANQDQIAQMNLDKLDEAIEKQLMCKTYTVKYDLSLSIAKEIYSVGCNQYQFKNFNGKFKKQAEEETFNSICN